ncbi:hypothetical protein M0804_014979 [Polistes exclamans]|nr:hypothetical protein M0804_014982 [Polistes exclamans]KAI4474171.1 hypothetical protein M0804_014979 [Polistes exclamans]
MNTKGNSKATSTSFGGFKRRQPPQRSRDNARFDFDSNSRIVLFNPAPPPPPPPPQNHHHHHHDRDSSGWSLKALRIWWDEKSYDSYLAFERGCD